jgi:PEP-CTERM motif
MTSRTLSVPVAIARSSLLTPAARLALASLALCAASAQAQSLLGQVVEIQVRANDLSVPGFVASDITAPLTAAGHSWVLDPVQLASTLGDGGLSFTLGLNTLTVEYSSGTAGALRDLAFGLFLGFGNPLQFTSVTKLSDSFVGHGSGASSGAIPAGYYAGFRLNQVDLPSVAGPYSASATYAFTFNNVSAVPEPSAALMAGAGLLALAWRRRSLASKGEQATV